MRFKATFKTTDQAFAADFGAVQTASDGGYERGYESGYGKGHVDGYGKGHTEGHDEGYSEGYGAGLADGASESAELEAKIDESGLVEYMDPPPATLSEKIDRLIAYAELWKYTSSWNLQNTTGLTEIPVYINKHLGPYALYGTTNLKRMVGVRSSTNMTLAFGNSGIEVIERPFDFSNITSASGFSPFLSAGKLVEVRIVEGTMSFGTTISSPYLSDDSIQSIFYGLADLTGKTRQKLSVHSAVYKRIPDDLFLYADARNWDVE